MGRFGPPRLEYGVYPAQCLLYRSCRFPPPPSDAALLQRFDAGDRAALDDLFRRHRSVAYRVAYRLLGREADALDAVQNGFVKALTHLERFRGGVRSRPGSCGSSATRRSISADSVKHERANRTSAIDDPPDRYGPTELPAPDTEVARAELRAIIDRALDRLPESQRQTFVLHVDGELSYRQIADAMGISIGTVMSRLYYARQKLKLLLADQVEP